MPTRTTTKRDNHMFLRIAIALQTAAVFVQAITAGLLLSSPYGGALHSAGSYTLFVVVVVHVVVAIVTWRPGGGSPRPILYAAGFLVITSAQVALGITHVKTLHIPLGVLLFGLSVLQLVWIWTGRRTHLAAASA
jgi:cytochrome b561